MSSLAPPASQTNATVAAINSALAAQTMGNQLGGANIGPTSTSPTMGYPAVEGASPGLGGFAGNPASPGPSPTAVAAAPTAPATVAAAPAAPALGFAPATAPASTSVSPSAVALAPAQAPTASQVASPTPTVANQTASQTTAGGISQLLQDILGITGSNPTTLLQLAQALFGSQAA